MRTLHLRRRNVNLVIVVGNRKVVESFLVGCNQFGSRLGSSRESANVGSQIVSEGHAGSSVGSSSLCEGDSRLSRVTIGRVDVFGRLRAELERRSREVASCSCSRHVVLDGVDGRGGHGSRPERVVGGRSTQDGSGLFSRSSALLPLETRVGGDGSGPSLSLFRLSSSPESNGDTSEDSKDDEGDNDGSSDGSFGNSLVVFGAGDSLDDGITTAGDCRTVGSSGGSGRCDGRVVVDRELGALRVGSVDPVFSMVEDSEVQAGGRCRVPPFRVQIDIQSSFTEIRTVPTLNKPLSGGRGVEVNVDRVGHGAFGVPFD